MHKHNALVQPLPTADIAPLPLSHNANTDNDTILNCYLKLKAFQTNFKRECPGAELSHPMIYSQS